MDRTSRDNSFTSGRRPLALTCQNRNLCVRDQPPIRTCKNSRCQQQLYFLAYVQNYYVSPSSPTPNFHWCKENQREITKFVSVLPPVAVRVERTFSRDRNFNSSSKIYCTYCVQPDANFGTTMSLPFPLQCNKSYQYNSFHGNDHVSS